MRTETTTNYGLIGKNSLQLLKVKVNTIKLKLYYTEDEPKKRRRQIQTLWSGLRKHGMLSISRARRPSRRIKSHASNKNL
jgi:hypothetical protein